MHKSIPARQAQERHTTRIVAAARRKQPADREAYLPPRPWAVLPTRDGLRMVDAGGVQVRLSREVMVLIVGAVNIHAAAAAEPEE